jgi:hypothetical protein
MDAHGSYVALSRHRDGMDLHYGRDDFADQDRLVGALSRDRAKDMASDYERPDPARNYAERRGIAFRARVAEIVRKTPEKARGLFEGLSLSAGPVSGHGGASGPERGSADGEMGRRDPVGPEKEAPENPEEALRRARTDALVRHARASDAILDVKRQSLTPSLEQRRELGAARRAFDEVRPHGWQDAEAAYSKDNSLAREAGSGRVNRAIRALQLETELRTDPQRRADRFVEDWRKLDQTSRRQYETGDIMAHKATRRAMGDMAKSLERDPQLESILANRKRELGIGIESGRSLGRELAFSHGIDLGRGRGIGL